MKKTILIIVSVLIVLGIVAGFWIFSNNNKSLSDNNSNSSNNHVENISTNNSTQNILNELENTSIPNNTIIQPRSEPAPETDVATFSTNLKGDSARLNNIGITCNTINGTTIAPGETFSFNAIVGQPTAEKGYQEADVFVNKKIDLPKDYAPGENATARNQLNKLIQDARNQDLDLVFRSGYRSYESQEQLYKDYVARDGEEAANQYSATPGNSEHQTGLAFDVGSDTATDDFRSSFGDTDEGKWMEKHAHEYGFIIRYLEGKEDITGYQYEPWHLRYVGKDLAQKIHQKNVTLEEYFDYGY